MSSLPDGNLRNSPVLVSAFNPQTNQYQQIGKTIVAAIRKSGNIIILVMGPNRQAISMCPATPQINWVIQNDVYCSYVDSRNARFLLLFDNAQECQLFTAIALSAKLAQSPEPICIVQSDGPLMNGSDRLNVKYRCYDFTQPKIEAPIMQEDNFEISSTDSTPLTTIIKSGHFGSKFIVQYPNNVIAIVESIYEKKELPSITSSTPQSESPKSDSPKPKPKKPKTPNPEPPAPQPQSQPPTPQPSQSSPQIPPQQTSIQPTEPPQQQPMYDSQLESIRNEMQAKFTELSQMIASLRRTQVGYSNIPLSSDILVSSVQRLLHENQVKDVLISEKQELINLLRERHSDTRERDALRIQLAELSSKLSAQRQLTQQKRDQKEKLNKQIEELREQIEKAKIDSEKRLSELNLQLEEEKQKQFQELEQQRKQLEWNAKNAEEEVNKIKAEYQRALDENKMLKQKASKDMSKELEKMKKAMPVLMQRTIKQMVSGVYQMIRDNFDEETEYDGLTVMKAIRNALQAQTNEMLEQIDPQDDDEEEEDEE
ncbi:hypothetical protein GPJ56_002458 [Histomonas meleagridis]|uniref:uncharacterized protein n=1 Tax=Histomonas meleagridis TaxID=135588 RepID=UPI00355ABD96|nr:hypothetical protein GPJ56_002458 [Histomonas meleagridis]KAH0798257.1 hypothetical protein GO595_008945 [Histomonas meleagridis]